MNFHLFCFDHVSGFVFCLTMRFFVYLSPIDVFAKSFRLVFTIQLIKTKVPLIILHSTIGFLLSSCDSFQLVVNSFHEIYSIWYAIEIVRQFDDGAERVQFPVFTFDASFVKLGFFM